MTETESRKSHDDPLIVEPDTQYEQMMRHVRDRGRYKGDRTGTGTTSVFGYQLRYDLQKGFPLVTTKKVAVKPMVTELLWFLKGSTNIKWLQENGCKIWDEWADENGDLGPVYGAQWRSWPGQIDVAPPVSTTGDEKPSLPEGAKPILTVVDSEVSRMHTVFQKPIDQISWVINRLKTNPDCRRLIVSAWNPTDLPKMALAPCHALFQFYTHELTLEEREEIAIKVVDAVDCIYKRPKGWNTVENPQHELHVYFDALSVPRRALSCQLYQRSCDTFLGVPFNIASYSLLTHMVAQQVGMAVGDFVWTGGDVHLYSNHKEQVELQLSRVDQAHPFPTLKIGRKPDSIFDYEIADFEFVDYQYHPFIKAPVAV